MQLWDDRDRVLARVADDNLNPTERRLRANKLIGAGKQAVKDGKATTDELVEVAEQLVAQAAALARRIDADGPGPATSKELDAFPYLIRHLAKTQQPDRAVELLVAAWRWAGGCVQLRRSGTRGRTSMRAILAGFSGHPGVLLLRCP